MNEGVVGICRGRHSHLAREEHVESKDSRWERWSALRGIIMSFSWLSPRFQRRHAR